MRSLFLSPLVALSAAALFALAFMTYERVHHAFDWVYYHHFAIDMLGRLKADPEAFLRHLRELLGIKSGPLYALPLFAWMEFFGTSRTAFVLGLTLLYQVPYAIIVGLLCRVALPDQGRLAFTLGLAVTLLIPANWILTLQARPDIAPAGLIALAALFYIRDQAFVRWWTGPLIGAFFAVAIVARNHFSYAALSMMAAIALQQGFFLLQGRVGGWPDLLRRGVAFAMIGLAALAVAWLIAPGFIERSTTTNYGALFQSYKKPAADNISFFTAAFGATLILLAALGLTLARRAGILRGSVLSFLLLTCGIWLLVWLVLVRFPNPHRTLHVLPLLVALGVTALLIWLLMTKRRLAFFGVLALLLVNFATAFSPWQPPLLQQAQSAALLSRAYPPKRTADYDEIAKLVQTLRTIDQGRPIAVIASSQQFNDDLMAAAERTLHGDDRRLNFLLMPHVDSRDALPLELLLAAEIVVLALPLQTHLPEAEQDVVKASWALFANERAFSNDFRIEPHRYRLDGGVEIEVLTRIRPTSPGTAVATLVDIMAQLDERPGTQLDWISLSHRLGRDYDLALSDDGGTSLQFTPRDPNDQAPRFALIEPLAERAHLSGRIVLAESQCSSMILRAGLWTRDGRRVNTQDTRLAAGDALDLVVATELTPAEPRWLTIELIPDDAAASDPGLCAFALEGLRVGKAPAD